MSELAIERKAATARTRNKGLLQRIFRYKESYLLILPTFLLIALFNYYPAASALYHSFFEWNGANINRFTGFSNFVAMARDLILWQSFGNLLQITLISVVISLIFPLGAAALIFHLRDLRLAYFYRVLFVVPIVVPSLVVLKIWSFIYSPNLGLLNQTLRVMELETWVRPWLGDFNLALYAVMLIGFPWVAGIGTLIYLAGFQGIATELLDSAAIDGASTMQRFLFIEIPLVMSQIKLVLILTIIGSIQSFTTILVMTNGGPGTKTMVPGLFLYRNAMQYNKMGYACAIGTVLFLITLVLTYLNTRYLKSSVEFTGA